VVHAIDCNNDWDWSSHDLINEMVGLWVATKWGSTVWQIYKYTLIKQSVVYTNLLIENNGNLSFISYPWAL